MPHIRFWRPCLGLLVGLGLTLGACGPVATEGASPLDTPSVGEPAGGGVSIPGPAQPIADLVIRDAAALANVEPDTVEVVSIEAVSWPDSSLGCPQPGLVYAQVLTPGYEIVVRAGGQSYTYHTGSDGFVRCDGASMQPTAKARPDAAAAALVLQAQNDLSERLGTAPENVTVLSVEAVDWPDSSLGCPEPGMSYAQMIVPGYRIVLSARGQEYEYHADLARAIPCQDQSTQ